MKVSKWEQRLVKNVSGIACKKWEERRQYLGVSSVVFTSARKGATMLTIIKTRTKVEFF